MGRTVGEGGKARRQGGRDACDDRRSEGVRIDRAAGRVEVEAADHVKRSLEAIVGGRLKVGRERKKRMMKREAETAASDMTEEEKHDALIRAYIDESSSLRAHRAARMKIKASDFQVVTIIGKGAFGEVRIVRDAGV